MNPVYFTLVKDDENEENGPVTGGLDRHNRWCGRYAGQERMRQFPRLGVLIGCWLPFFAFVLILAPWLAPIWHKIEQFEELPFYGHWLVVFSDLGRTWLGLLVLLFVGVLALGDYLIHRLVTRRRLSPAIYWVWFTAVAVAGLAALAWGVDLFSEIFRHGGAH